MGWTLKGNLNYLSVTTAASNNLVAWSFDPTMVNNPYTPGQGKCLVVRSYVDSPQAVTHFYTYTLSSGSGLANCYIGLYNISGTLLGQTGDISTALNGTAGPITASISTGSITGLTYNQEVYLVLLIATGGTSPSFLSPHNYAINLAMTSDYRWQTAGSSLTTLPSTLPALSAASTGSQPPFLAVGP